MNIKKKWKAPTRSVICFQETRTQRTVKKRGQQDQHQADPVQPEAVADSEPLDPREIFGEQPFPGRPGLRFEVQGEHSEYEDEVG